MEELKIVKYDELAEKLGVSEALVRKVWKELPHFFVGQSRTLRGARFDLDDVINFLKKRDYEIEGEQLHLWTRRNL